MAKTVTCTRCGTCVERVGIYERESWNLIVDRRDTNPNLENPCASFETQAILCRQCYKSLQQWWLSEVAAPPWAWREISMV